MPQITVKNGKTFTVGAQTFRPGFVIPERIIKVYRGKKYQQLYEKTFITLEEYLKEEKKETEKKAEDEQQTESSRMPSGNYRSPED